MSWQNGTLIRTVANDFNSILYTVIYFLCIGSLYFSAEETNFHPPPDIPINQSYHNRHVFGLFYFIALSCLISQQREILSLSLHMSLVRVDLVPLMGVELGHFSGNGSCISKSDWKNPWLWISLISLGTVICVSVFEGEFPCVLLSCTFYFLWDCIPKAHMRLQTVRMWRTFRLSLGAFGTRRWGRCECVQCTILFFCKLFM